MRRSLVILLLASSLLSGCYTAHQFPPLPVLTRLASPSEYRLNYPAGPQGEASSCLVQRAEFEVTAMRGDTLHFSRARILKQDPAAAPCAPGAGFVHVAAHPDLSAERPRANLLFTGAGLIVAAPLVLLTFMLFGN